MMTQFSLRENFLLSALLFLGWSLTGCTQEPITVKPIPLLNHLDTVIDRGRQTVGKFDCFLVNRFNYSVEDIDFLDKWVQQHKAADFAQYDQYVIVIYKESSYTNEAHLKENPRDLDRYTLDHDWIYEARWDKGQYLNRYIIKDGNFVETKDTTHIEIKTKEK